MKTQVWKAQTGKTMVRSGNARDSSVSAVRPRTKTRANDVETSRVSPSVANRILHALMVPAMIMPVAGAMVRVALPIIRNDFQISADTTAWVAAAFTLPFMVLMPLYGRLSDVVGKRRLLLLGIVIVCVGTVMTIFSQGLGLLIAGRAVQGIGASGLMPLGMAFISAIFAADKRGRALGTWSQVGPIAGFVSPLAAGVVISLWGWRASFIIPLVVATIAFAVVHHFIPSGLSTIEPGYLRHFDWIGVLLLSGTGAGTLFYLSSRPITGAAPLTDWRLLLAAIALGSGLIWWEKHRQDPFIPLDVFHNLQFLQASGAASMRMLIMSGVGFLIPLYLLDVREMSAAAIGVMLVINPGAMALMVRQGGQIADRWGSRVPVLVGMTVQVSAIVMLFYLPATAPIVVLVVILALNGLGAGLMLAALHRSAMGDTEPARVGAVAGMYSMVRFAGMAVGTAMAGVILQYFLDSGLPTLEAYQWSFLVFGIAGIFGFIIGATMRETGARSPQKGA